MFKLERSQISSLLNNNTTGSTTAPGKTSPPIPIPAPKNSSEKENDIPGASGTSTSPSNNNNKESNCSSVPMEVSESPCSSSADSSYRTPSPIPTDSLLKDSSNKLASEMISSLKPGENKEESPPPSSTSPTSSPFSSSSTTPASSDVRTPSPAFRVRVQQPPQIHFESAGSYGLQRNVPFLLRNSSVWRPGILPPAPPTSKSTINTISLPSSSPSILNVPNHPHFEYLKLHFPSDICAVEEVTRRNRVQRHALSSSSSSLTPAQQESLLNLKVELQVFVVKENRRIKDPAQEVRDVFVVREHPTKIVRRGEELQISVRFHRLPSDFLSSSREFILYVKFIRMPASVPPSPSPSPSQSPSHSPSVNDQYEAGVGQIVFESDVNLHSKSRTKPGQSAKEAAAAREAQFFNQSREGSGSVSPIRVSPPPGSSFVSPQSQAYIPSYFGGSIPWMQPGSSSPSPSPTPSTFPSSDARSRSASPANEAAALLSFQKRSSNSPGPSEFGSRTAMSPLLELCEEADRAAKKTTRTTQDTRTEAEIEEARQRWRKFLQEVGVEDPIRASDEMVKEKIEIYQLPSLRFDMLRSLGFLVGDILRMLDHCQKHNLHPPSVVVTPAASDSEGTNLPPCPSPGIQHVTNRISSINLKQSSGGLNQQGATHLSPEFSSSVSRTSPRLRRSKFNAQDNASMMNEDEEDQEQEDVEKEGEEEEEGELQIDDPYDDEYQEGHSDGERKRRRSAFSDPRMRKIGGNSSPYKLRRSTSGTPTSGSFSSSNSSSSIASSSHSASETPTTEKTELDVFDALLKLSGSPPARRVPAHLSPNPNGRSKLSSSLGSIPTTSNHSPFTSSPLSISSSTQSASGSTPQKKIREPVSAAQACAHIRETIRLTQRFAEKMVSKISDINNLENELANRTSEMGCVIEHLEDCLAFSSPNSSPYSLAEIESVSRRLGGDSDVYSSEFSDSIGSDHSPSIRRSGSSSALSSSGASPSIIALRSSAGRVPFSSGSYSSDTDTDTGSGVDDELGGLEDDRGDELPFEFQPLAYYIGVIKAHLEIRKPERTRKVSGMKRESLRKEYVLVPIEEASRVLGISTTKLSRAYKSLSILSRCGWVFKGRKRRLRWPTRPLRVLLRYISEKYLADMLATFSSLEDQQKKLELSSCSSSSSSSASSSSSYSTTKPTGSSLGHILN